MTISASTNTGARCTIHVRYPSGQLSSARTCGYKIVGPDGIVAWDWRPRPVNQGRTATVTCTLGGPAEQRGPFAIDDD